ncbi:MAG: hypothetical protein LUQ07_01925 [Methanospirillum sp.]|nr:hypothetical protein [Methanospirillum sp.]
MLFPLAGSAVVADKIQTNLSIATDPADPGEDLAFVINGVLLDSDDNPLGNKKITLENSESEDMDSDYAFVAVTTTDTDGKYSFFRPGSSPVEFLRVKYNGNDRYEESVSEVIPGHTSRAPRVTDEIVPTVTKSETKITASVSPSNPNPGQTVKISGQLIGANGTPLGGKIVYLEISDRMGNQGDFAISGKGETDKNGYFQFLIGGGSTTNYIQIHFTGDDSNIESYSGMITVI